MRMLAALTFLSTGLISCASNTGTAPTRMAGANPCAANPCGAARNPCAQNPCGARNPCAANPCGGGGSASGAMAEVDFAAWQTWTKVNPQRFFTKAHGEKWADVYVEPQDASAYVKRSAPARVGMRVVKAIHDDASAAHPAKLTVMAKMAPGYDPKHGDWYYAALAPDGKTAMAQGKVGMCIDCHEQADKHDYLFGLKK